MRGFDPVPAGSVLPILFDSFAGSTGASITITGLAVTDIEVYKGTSMTQRSSDAGYALLDTDGIDIDGITGIHGFSIDLGDNTDAGFYAAGSFYNVIVSAVTVDAQTVNFIAASFRIVAAENTAGTPVADAVRVGGTAQTAGDIIGDTNDIQTRLPAALVGGRMDASVGAMAANVLNAAAIATDAIDSDAIAASAVAEIQSGLATAATLSTVAGYIDTEIADIQARLPAALTGAGNMKVDVLAVNGSTNAAANLARGTLGTSLGTVGAASTTTSIVTSSLDPAAATIDQFKGRIITFDRATTTANLRGQATDITASTAGGVLTVTALTDAPVSGDTFVIT